MIGVVSVALIAAALAASLELPREPAIFVCGMVSGWGLGLLLIPHLIHRKSAVLWRKHQKRKTDPVTTYSVMATAFRPAALAWSPDEWSGRNGEARKFRISLGYQGRRKHRKSREPLFGVGGSFITSLAIR